MIQKFINKFDDEMQKRFRGDYGAAAYGEVFTIAIMFGTYELLLHRIPPEHHLRFKVHWYGSWAGTHPFHPVRMAAQDAIAAAARSTYHPEHNHLQAQFEKLCKTIHAKVEEVAQYREHGHTASTDVKAGSIMEKIAEMDLYLDLLFEPPQRRHS